VFCRRRADPKPSFEAERRRLPAMCRLRLIYHKTDLLPGGAAGFPDIARCEEPGLSALKGQGLDELGATSGGAGYQRENSGSAVGSPPPHLEALEARANYLQAAETQCPAAGRKFWPRSCATRNGRGARSRDGTTEELRAGILRPFASEK